MTNKINVAFTCNINSRFEIEQIPEMKITPNKCSKAK